MSTTITTVWLVEDHEDCRHMVARVINRAPAIRCEHSFSTCEEALEALGAHRESLIGRAVTLFKGEAHYAREAEGIVDRCEAQRMAAHRNLEALKEKQFAAAQQARMRHAQERKGIAELHRMERQQLGQAQDRNRGQEIGVSQRAFERAADRKQQTLEQAHGLRRGPSR